MDLKYVDYNLGKITARYLFCEKTKKVSMILLPVGMNTSFEQRRKYLNLPEFDKLNMTFEAWNVGNLCHLAIRQYSQSNGAGTTQKYSPVNDML